MTSVLHTPALDYDRMFQRPQQLMRQFAQNSWQVIYCNRTQVLGRALQQAENNLYICHDYAGLVRSRPACDIVWNSWPQHYGEKNTLGEKLFVYDCMDNFPAWQEQEKRMLLTADLIFTSSEPLRHLLSKQHPHVHLVRNGCDIHFFAPRPWPPPQDLDLARRPVMGYVGALAPWVDLGIIAALARHFPHGQVVMLGASLLNAPLSLPPNVHYLGCKPYRELPSYLHHLDVALIPFKLNNTTRATNPVKVYEYLAAGKPVVATPLPELTDLTGVYLAGTQQEFVARVEEALAEKDPSLYEERLSQARANSWQQRFQTIQEVLASMGIGL